MPKKISADSWERCISNVLYYDTHTKQYYRDKVWRDSEGNKREERVPTDFPKWS